MVTGGPQGVSTVPMVSRRTPVTGGPHGDLVVTGGPDGVNAAPKETGRSPWCQQDLRVTEVSPR